MYAPLSSHKVDALAWSILTIPTTRIWASADIHTLQMLFATAPPQRARQEAKRESPSKTPSLGAEVRWSVKNSRIWKDFQH